MDMQFHVASAPRSRESLIGCLIFIGHFPQQNTIICGSFAKNDMQLKASYDSTPPCNICAVFERVMSHIQMSRVTHTHESCHTNDWDKWVMSHISIVEWINWKTKSWEMQRHVTCTTFEKVMSHIWSCRQCSKFGTSFRCTGYIRECDNLI